MIFTDKAAREKIATLESRVSELEADLVLKDSAIDAHAAEISERDQTIAEHVSTIASRDEQINNLQADVDKANTSLETAAAEIAEKDKAIAAAKESAGAEATQILASIGQPEPLPLNGETNEPQAITREQFNALDHIARNKFIAEGGKIKK